MEVKYNKIVGDFSIKFDANHIAIISTNNIMKFRDKIINLNEKKFENFIVDLWGIVIENRGNIKIKKDDMLILQDLIDKCIDKELPNEVKLMELGFSSAPQSAYTKSGISFITKFLQETWSNLESVKISKIDILNDANYIFPKEFIEKSSQFTTPFIDALDNALEIANENQNKSNFFLMRDAIGHLFLLIIIDKNLFMFDSAGQKYGRPKTSLGFAENTNTLKLHEIPYTNMYLEFLKTNSEWNLYFNLNTLQQDFINCTIFAIDFLDGFCEKISKNNILKIPNEFANYLIKYFPVTLSENTQIHHEGSIDVMYELLKQSYKDELVYNRPMLPDPLARTSQLNKFFTEKAKDICPNSIQINLEPKTIRGENGNIIEILVNKRIDKRRKEVEEILLGAKNTWNKF